MKTKHDTAPVAVVPPALGPSFAHIWSADLQKVGRRLRKDHPFWSAAKVEALIREYRVFLSLILLSGKEIPMSNELVDEVWHTHLLFTQDYADFCQAAFSGFLHHEPAGETAETSAATVDFFEEHQRIFGTAPSAVWFGPWWARFLRSSRISRKICIQTGTAKLCTASAPAKLCLATGVVTP